MKSLTTTVGRRARRAFGRKGFAVMSGSPQPAQPRKTQRPSGGDYEGFVDGALRDHVVGTGAPPSAEELEPRELLRYAAGKATDDERTATEDFLKRSRWAYERVVTLVRSNRPGETGLRGHIGKRLLNRTDANRLKAVTIVGQAILEVEGVKTSSLEDAWKSLEKSGSPKTRAACLIGLARHEEARKLLESQGGKDAVWDLLRRMSSASLASDAERADDAALIALLDAFPSL